MDKFVSGSGVLEMSQEQLLDLIVIRFLSIRKLDWWLQAN
jgi:hypothetical protein